MTVQIQRPLRGSRISSFYPIKNLPSLASLDSAFQLQEYISLLIRLDVHDVDAIVSLPGKKDVDGERDKDKDREKDTDKDDEKDLDDGTGADGEKPAGEKERKAGGDISVDEACWIYEQLRRLAQDLSHPLITTLQQECTRASCPEMKAGEWLYLCVAHGNEGAMEQCCAIDYILHTVDSATALLNSPRAFPSRLQIPSTSHRHFSSLARRLGRIFAHAYFHHREAFEQAEVESSLYARFLALTARFDLVPPEFLVIPPVRVVADQGRGLDRERDRDRSERGERDGEVQPPRLLAAALDPLGRGDREWVDGEETAKKEQAEEDQWDQWASVVSIERAKSHSPPGLGRGKGNVGGNRSGSESPRKIGRTRTDTMVFSDASAFVERFAEDAGKAGHEPEAETEKVVPPSPGLSEEGEKRGVKEPDPTPVTEPESEPTSEQEPVSLPPQPEPEPELEHAPLAHDQSPQRTPEDDATPLPVEPPTEEIVVPVSDTSETPTPEKDAEPAPHAVTEPQVEDSSTSSVVDPEPTAEDGAEPVREAESEAEAEPDTQVVSDTAPMDQDPASAPVLVPEAGDGASAAVSETEAVESSEDVATDAENTANNVGEGDCGGSVPTEEGEVPADADAVEGEKEEEDKEAKAAGEASGETEEKPKDGEGDEGDAGADSHVEESD